MWLPIKPQNYRMISGIRETELWEKARWVWEVCCIFKMRKGIFKLEVVIWLHTLGFMDKDTEAWENEMFCPQTMGTW